MSVGLKRKPCSICFSINLKSSSQQSESRFVLPQRFFIDLARFGQFDRSSDSKVKVTQELSRVVHRSSPQIGFGVGDGPKAFFLLVAPYRTFQYSLLLLRQWFSISYCRLRNQRSQVVTNQQSTELRLSWTRLRWALCIKTSSIKTCIHRHARIVSLVTTPNWCYRKLSSILTDRVMTLEERDFTSFEGPDDLKFSFWVHTNSSNHRCWVSTRKTSECGWRSGSDSLRTRSFYDQRGWALYYSELGRRFNPAVLIWSLTNVTRIIDKYFTVRIKNLPTSCSRNG